MISTTRGPVSNRHDVTLNPSPVPYHTRTSPRGETARCRPLGRGWLCALLVLPGCSHPEDRPIENRPPAVSITGGPLEGSRQSYTARVFWSGWDEDGFIDHYEYTSDPPPAFTEEEIAHPETSPGLSLSIREGPASDRDTLRVSKLVGDDVVSFDWVETPEFSRSFAFSTGSAESVSVGGNLAPTNVFSGIHRIYVRCRDDQDAPSEPDHIGYTALSITPSSEILQPDIRLEINNLGSVLSARWDGVDPDSPTAEKRPVGYLYKLLRIDTLLPPVPLISVSSPDILFRRGGEWTLQSADTLGQRINLGTPGQYVFGVRAVDVAGAVEPFLNWGRNAFKFQSFPNGGKPILTLNGNTIRTVTFRGTGKVLEAEVPAGAKLYFRWGASAEDYGGTIEAYSWGVDIPDLAAEGPASGWSGWGQTLGPSEPIVFREPGIRVLYVRVRDVAGAMTIATLFLRVVEFTRELDVLMVDDSFDDIVPRDAEHDAFWRDLLASYASYPTGETSELGTFGAGDGGTLSPEPPPLSELGRYKLVIWETRGSGYNARTALVRAVSATPLLATYLASGGMLWLGGRLTVGATFGSTDPFTADLAYPKRMEPGNFAYDFLKLHSNKVNNDRGQGAQNNIYRALPYPDQPAIYDTLTVDPSKLTQGRLGPAGADAVFDPLLAESETNPPFRGDIDTLYAYGAVGPILQGRSSSYHNRLTAIRWHDPDPDREHGRTQWFGFPMYYFDTNDARETLRRSLDWFFEEASTPSPGPSPEERY